MYLAAEGGCRPLTGLLGVFNESEHRSARRKGQTIRASIQELENWFTQSLYVFAPDSQYTCCRMSHTMDDGKMMSCDRQALVLPMLGLYGEIYRRRKDPSVTNVYEDIKAEKDAIFPPSFQFKTERGWNSRPLFGDLLERLEWKIDHMSTNPDVSSVTGPEVNILQIFRLIFNSVVRRVQAWRLALQEWRDARASVDVRGLMSTQGRRRRRSSHLAVGPFVSTATDSQDGVEMGALGSPRGTLARHAAKTASSEAPFCGQVDSMMQVQF